MLKIFFFFIYLSRTNEDSLNLAWEKGLKVIKDRKLNVFKIECDVVIDGSGCGGGVAAAVLANLRQKVIVVKKGHYIVAEDYSSLEGPSLNQLYESGGVLSTLDGKCMKLSGSTVGGGLAVTGGIITSLYKISSHESESDVQTVIEAPILGPASFGVLLPWVSGHDAKKKLLKYLRTGHLLTLGKDQRSGEVKQEGRISYKLDPLDKENLKTGMRRALQILVVAGATEVGIHKGDGPRIMCKGVKEKKLEEFLDTLIPCGGLKSNGELWNIYYSSHQMGSYRMGATEEDGVVDENDKKHGIMMQTCQKMGNIHPDLTVTSEERILDAILLWGTHNNRLCGWQAVDAYVMTSTPELLFGYSVINQHRRSSCKELQYLCDGGNNGVIYFANTSYGEHRWVNPILAKKICVTAGSPPARYTDPKALVSRAF
ncbi:hypothetical protein GIB67_001873 [Kingdonia uniflora]|uniref:Glucose-methanol-choline oxidoreductase C-terminal domain-containing protein n=1 Tax=Kingdonia uniflora TaxID=39325 RepID=A0A7J7LQP5_9MAGN|nr:hypothetical protein GIB67_001873 [Kingdonia uniflora]